MLKKIERFLVEHLKKLKKLIPILHSSEVASVFKRFKDVLKEIEPEADEVIGLLTSFFLMIASLGLVAIVLVICFMFGG